MAKRKSKRKSRRKHAGAGSYCVTTTKPKSGNAARGKSKGLKFSTVCYKTHDKAVSALSRRSPGSYSAMLHRRRSGR